MAFKLFFNAAYNKQMISAFFLLPIPMLVVGEG